MNETDFKKNVSLISQSTLFDRAIKLQSLFGNQDRRQMLILRNDETRM